MTDAASASRAAVTAAHQGLLPVLLGVGLTPAPVLRLALLGVVLGPPAVWLKIDVLLPAVGQAVPVATLGVPPPPPPAPGLTLEQARLGTLAGIMDTGADVPVLLVLLGRPPVVPDAEVPAGAAPFSAMANEIAGAIERVTGAGKLPLATPAGPPVNALSAGAMGGGDRDATGGTAAAGAAAAASAPPPAAWALPPAACVPPAAGALLSAAGVLPASGGVRWQPPAARTAIPPSTRHVAHGNLEEPLAFMVSPSRKSAAGYGRQRRWPGSAWPAPCFKGTGR